MADISKHFLRIDRRVSKPEPRAIFYGLAVFLCVIVVAGLFDRQQSKMHQLSVEANAAEIGVQLAETIENEISKRLVMV